MLKKLKINKVIVLI